MVAAGLINAAGWAKIQAAQVDGSWISLDAVEALVVPDDLQRALTADPQADRYWQSLSPGKRKVFLQQLASAKRPATRLKKISAIVNPSN